MIRCVYAFVQQRRVLGIWFAPRFGSADERFGQVVESQVDSLLASGYSLYVAPLSEEEWRTAPERSDYYVAELQRLLH